MTLPVEQSAKGVLRTATWGAVAAAALLVSMALIVRAASSAGPLTSLEWFDVFLVQLVSTLPLAW